MVFGGSTPSLTANTEKYDGTAWTEAPNLGATVQKNRGTGTKALALSFGGAPDTDGTQEWTSSLGARTADTT